MINYAVFNRERLRTEPFKWVALSEMLDQSSAVALHEQFPHGSLRESRSESAHYLLADRTVIDEGRCVPGDALPAVWASLVDELLAPTYRNAVEDVLSVDLTGTKLKVRLCRYDAGCWMLPHTDRPDRVVTQITYLNPDWQPEWGGSLRILNSLDEADVAAELYPLFNTSVAFVRSDDSFHSVAPVTEAARTSRLSILQQFVRQ